MNQKPDDSALIINGETPLSGVVEVSGSKHSILHILGASLLLDGEFVLNNTPNIWDVWNMLEIYESLGMVYAFQDKNLQISISSARFNYTELSFSAGGKQIINK